MQLSFKEHMRGDTIIEVVMSIAIAAAVIAGSYALSNRSLAEGISASQHSQAIKIAQTQIEALKSRQREAANDSGPWNTYYNITTNLLPSQNNFCVYTGATVMKDVSGTVLANWKPQYNGTGTSAFNGTNLKVGAGTNDYKAICTDTGNAATAKFFTNITLITYPGHPLRKPTYSITVRWDPPNGGPYSQSQLYYRF
jgi:Tfp pilus assembly protein PilV